MDARDLYDFDEYFVRYMRIHPALTFEPTGINKARLDKQVEFLVAIDSGKMVVDEARERYSKFMTEVRDSRIVVSDLEYALAQEAKQRISAAKEAERARLEYILSNI
jgi:hypothetical protein